MLNYYPIGDIYDRNNPKLEKDYYSYLREKRMSKLKVVTIGKRRIGSLIFDSRLVIVLLLIPFFKNAFFDYFGKLSFVFNALIFIESILFFLLCTQETRWNKYESCIFAFLIWTYFIAPLAHGHAAPSIFYFCEALGIISFFKMGFKYNRENIIEAASNLFTVMVILNYATLYIYPQGVGVEDGTSLYLFGLRTGFSLYIIPGVLLNLLNDIQNEKIFSVNTLLTIMFGTLALLNKMVATGLLELIVIGGLYLVLNRPKMIEKFNIVIFTLIFFVLDVSVTILGSKFDILGIVAGLFGKDATFSNRTFIWVKAVQKIASSPIFGSGADNLVSGGTYMLQAHNQWLNVIIEGGYVAFALFFIGLLISVLDLYKSKTKKWYKPLVICISAILIGSLAEIQTYVPFIYFIFDLPILLRENKGEMKYA